MLDYNINNYLCKARNIDGNFYRLVMDHLYEPINKDKYWVIIIAFLVGLYLQPHDNIYGVIFLTMSWDRQQLQVSIRLMADNFSS